LQRWGVIFRSLIDKEAFAPPWRVLVAKLRKLELQGIVRGGRFVSGVGGEQFAYSETVSDLRKLHNANTANSKPAYHCLSATDPLNLLNLILPNRKLSRIASNRVLYQGGIPIAVMESGEVRYLRETADDKKWEIQQLLMKRSFPGKLRSYLGSR
jgi:ATP-dependent Lhr-like helicase